MFSLRAGYPGIGKKDAIEGLSFGAGVKYPIMNSNNYLSVDYTSSDFGPRGWHPINTQPHTLLHCHATHVHTHAHMQLY